MDLKRYKEIEGIDALKTLANEEAIYRNNWMWKVVDGRLKSKNINSKDWSYSTKDINDLICPSDEDESNYFVKKPFDVRKEMLARPNEWVGAYQVDKGNWYKVGFDFLEMTAVETQLEYGEVKPDYLEDAVLLASKYWIDKCIPIEDVPKEDLL